MPASSKIFFNRPCQSFHRRLNIAVPAPEPIEIAFGRRCRQFADQVGRKPDIDVHVCFPGDQSHAPVLNPFNLAPYRVHDPQSRIPQRQTDFSGKTAARIVCDLRNLSIQNFEAPPENAECPTTPGEIDEDYLLRHSNPFAMEAWRRERAENPILRRYAGEVCTGKPTARYGGAGDSTEPDTARCRTFERNEPRRIRTIIVREPAALKL